MEVYKAIAKVSAALAEEGISKTRSNTQQNFKFRGIDEILNALAPILAKNELVVIPRVASSDRQEKPTKNGGVLNYVTLTVEFDLVSAKDGSKHTAVIVGEAMDAGDKAANKAMSIAYKYMAILTFCIPTEGDNDPDASSHEIAAKPNASQSPKPDPSQSRKISEAQLKRFITIAAKMAGLNKTSENCWLKQEYSAARIFLWNCMTLSLTC